jgi:hypothetical protein
MKTSAHIITSAALAGALYAHSHSAPESAVCFLSGVLIDLDHLIDFYLFSGEKFSVEAFFSWCLERWKKITLLFHSYELYGMLCLAAGYFDSAVLRGVLWGAGLHLGLDQIANSRKYRLSPWFYLLGYRIAVGFKRERLMLSSQFANLSRSPEKDH